jgi:hypothetical protein
MKDYVYRYPGTYVSEPLEISRFKCRPTDLVIFTFLKNNLKSWIASKHIFLSHLFRSYLYKWKFGMNICKILRGLLIAMIFNTNI